MGDQGLFAGHCLPCPRRSYAVVFEIHGAPKAVFSEYSARKSGQRGASVE